MSQTQTRRSSQVDLLHGPILKSLLLFALPIMAGNLLQQLYNIVTRRPKKPQRHTTHFG